jgi:hypothetical protein
MVLPPTVPLTRSCGLARGFCSAMTRLKPDTAVVANTAKSNTTAAAIASAVVRKAGLLSRYTHGRPEGLHDDP